MAKAYCSTIFQQSAPEIWKIVRDFNNYPVWVEGAGESRIEDGRSGDSVGAIRDVLYQGRRIRQRLLALSDVELAQTYEFCGPASLPVTDFQGCLAGHAGRRRRSRLCRVVGDVRLRARNAQGTDRYTHRPVCQIARIPAQPVGSARAGPGGGTGKLSRGRRFRAT